MYQRRNYWLRIKRVSRAYVWCCGLIEITASDPGHLASGIMAASIKSSTAIIGCNRYEKSNLPINIKASYWLRPPDFFGTIFNSYRTYCSVHNLISVYSEQSGCWCLVSYVVAGHPQSFLAFSVCGRFGLWPFRFVAIPVCGRFGLWPFWFVTVMTFYRHNYHKLLTYSFPLRHC